MLCPGTTKNDLCSMQYNLRININTIRQYTRLKESGPIVLRPEIMSHLSKNIFLKVRSLRKVNKPEQK